MLVVAFVVSLSAASAVIAVEGRQAAVVISSGSRLLLEETTSATHEEGRLMRRHFGIQKAAATLGVTQETTVNEGVRLPWTQQNLAHPSLKINPKHTDPCYSQSFTHLIDGKHSTRIEHNECLNALNLDTFTIQAIVVPLSDSALHSFVPLHFSGQATKASDVGISLGASPSRTNLQLALADGRYQDVKTFPFEGLDLAVRQAVTFAVECWKSPGGRDCRVAVNGTVRGQAQHFSKVSGNIYNLDGATFGNNAGWTFAGYLNSLQVCHAAAGGLEQTTLTTTWLGSAAICAGRPVYSVSEKEAMCDTFDCKKYDLIHVRDAATRGCRFKIDCRERFDKGSCCMKKPYDPSNFMPCLYAQMPRSRCLVQYAPSKRCAVEKRERDFVTCFYDFVPPGKLITQHFWLFTPILAVLCLVFLAVTCSMVVAFLIRFLYRRWKVQTMISWMDERAFLEVPAKIDKETGLTFRALGAALRHKSQDLAGHAEYDLFYPDIMISCPLGHRKNDAEDCGPGMYYALALATALLNAGMPCFAGVMVPAKDEESEMMDKLTSSHSKCRVLIVIDCEALYESRQSLSEIYGAQKRCVNHILPLSFDGESPGKAEQWPMIGPTEFEWLNMRMAVQHHFGSLSTVPESPATVVAEPKALLQIVEFVKGCRLGALDEREYLMQIPKCISTDVDNELRQVSLSLLQMQLGRAASEGTKKFSPEVVIAFAAGPRKGVDDEGCGPGAYHALAITIALMKSGILCFSSLMCQHDHHAYFRKAEGPDSQVIDKLMSESSKCKLLVVLRTEALYTSESCLRQIHAAQEQKVPHMLPLSFGEIPKEEDQWTCCKSTDAAKDLERLHELKALVKMRQDVQGHFCKLDAIPEAPATVMDTSDALPKIVEFIKATVELERKKTEEKRQKAKEAQQQEKLVEQKAEDEYKATRLPQPQSDAKDTKAPSNARDLSSAFERITTDPTTTLEEGAPTGSGPVAAPKPVAGHDGSAPEELSPTKSSEPEAVAAEGRQLAPAAGAGSAKEPPAADSVFSPGTSVPASVESAGAQSTDHEEVVF